MTTVGPEYVRCKLCGKNKKPIGRSMPPEMHGTMCTSDTCKGYYDKPEASMLWPGEKSDE